MSSIKTEVSKEDNSVVLTLTQADSRVTIKYPENYINTEELLKREPSDNPVLDLLVLTLAPLIVQTWLGVMPPIAVLAACQVMISKCVYDLHDISEIDSAKEVDDFFKRVFRKNIRETLRFVDDKLVDVIYQNIIGDLDDYAREQFAEFVPELKR